MRPRLPFCAVVIAALFAGLAHASDVGPPLPPDDDDDRFATPTTEDAIGRVVAPVFVNGAGPFRFIVDTGANRSTLSPHLARTLGIDPTHAPRQLVHGVTDAEAAPVVTVGELRAGRIIRRGLALPVVSNRIHANADGILGADQMAGGRLTIDFSRDRVDVTGGGPPPRQGVFVLPAQMRFGQLPLVTVRIGRVTAKAVIDTGAERSLGNEALRAALERTRAMNSYGAATVYGAVGADATAELVWAPRLTVAGVHINGLPILFGDTHFFELWDLQQEPAMLIGMDVIGQLDTLVIDYRRHEVMLQFRGSGTSVNPRARGSRL